MKAKGPLCTSRLLQHRCVLSEETEGMCNFGEGLQKGSEENRWIVASVCTIYSPSFPGCLIPFLSSDILMSAKCLMYCFMKSIGDWTAYLGKGEKMFYVLPAIQWPCHHWIKHILHQHGCIRAND